MNGAVTANGGQALVTTDASGDLLMLAATDYVNNAIIPNSAGANLRIIATGGLGSGPTTSGYVGLGAGTTDVNTLVNAYTSGTTTIDITNSGANPGNILRLCADRVDRVGGGELVLGLSRQRRP